VVYEDIDGNGSQDLLSGEMGIEGWTVELYWEGQLVTSTASGADGTFSFAGLGNTGTTMFSVCLGAPPASWSAGHVQTQPVGAMASGCSGTGYAFTINNQFPTRTVTKFGEMMQ